MPNLFSYGTLREDKVQHAVFGHTIKGASDAIVGYRLVAMTITDPGAIAISGKSDHTILDPTGDDRDQIEGIVLALTDRELEQADAYEDAAYKRIEVRLRSGVHAWVYVRA